MRFVLWEGPPEGWDHALMGCGKFALADFEQWFVCVARVAHEGPHILYPWGPRGRSLREGLLFHEGNTLSTVSTEQDGYEQLSLETLLRTKKRLVGGEHDTGQDLSQGG